MLGSAITRSSIHIRSITLCAALTLAAGLIGCGSEPSAPTVEPQVAPPAIAKEGVLTVGVNLGSAPYATEVDGGSYAGLDAEFAMELAKNLGLTVEFVAVGPDAVSGALAAGDADIVMSAPLGSVDATVVGSYLTAGAALYAAPSVEGEFTGASVGEAVVGVQQDSPAYWWFTQNRGEDSVKVYGTAVEALEAAATGEVTYAAVDSVVGDYAVTADLAVRRVGWVTEPIDRGVAVRADNAELVEAVATQYRTLDEAGWIEALVRRWLVPVSDGTAGSETTVSAAE